MKLVILLPTSGTVHTRFMASLVGLTQSLQRKGIGFALKHYEFSDLVMSRNYLVSYFLSQPTFTHALLLDSDLDFKPDQFFRLADLNVDFAAAAYPDRRVTGRVLASAMQDAQENNLDLDANGSVSKLLARHMRYVTTNSFGTGHKFTPERKGQFETVATIGTGFMLISRSVVEQIADGGHARSLPRTGGLPIYRDAHRFYDFFSHHLTPEEDAMYGEDQSFCRRWVLGCGGKIWLDRGSQITHIGEFSYFGDYSHQSGLDSE